MNLRTLSFAALVVAAAVRVAAQSPAADWQTVETPHFRIHYPKPYEAWTMRAATKLESIREAVARETGFAADVRTDVLVVDPIAAANGLTYGLLDTPRIVLFAEPAEPAGQLGEYGDWIELLVTHELTHLVHLVRPSRNPTRHLAEQLLLPLGPISLGAPRWVNEGYATLIEGRLTGSGRPSSTFRAAVLRKWALSGRLPSYEQLSSDQRFLGMSMAYLIGSAYLDWLEQRSGAGSLPKLWARMTARQPRSFSQAFEGVFGDSPEKLYGIFTAELTRNAKPDSDLAEGELWQETTRSSGDPAVSPDGKRIALVIRDQRHQKLVIYSTGENEEQAKYEERMAKMLAKDPQDVAPVRTKPLPRKAVDTLEMPDGGDIESPRWMPDGKSIVFTHRVPDTDGDLHRDLFLWTPNEPVQRITHLADVYDADPISADEFIAVRSRYGATQLVRVRGDVVTPITEPSIDRVVSHPRVNGNRIAYVAHAEGAWHLVIREGDDERVIRLDGNVATPEWSGDTIYASVLAGGAIDIVRYPGGERVTRMSGGAFQPAPSPDGRLFFMSLEPDGMQLRVITKPTQQPSNPATEQPPPQPRNLATAQPTSQPKPYGIGHQEPTYILSGNSAPGAHTTELGARIGDVAGRLDTIAVASIGNDRSPRGATIATLWRGWPVAVRAQAYSAREPIGKQHGLELRAIWDAIHPLYRIDVSGGALARSPSSLGFVAASIRTHQPRLAEQVAVAVESKHARAFARIEAMLGSFRLGAEAQRDQSRKDEDILLGGIAPTILPPSAVANRVLDPALETATLRATRYTGARADLSLGGVTLFYRQHRMNERLNVEGVEIARRLPAQPLLKTPALDFTIGAARVLQRTRWWIGVRVSP